MYDELEQGGFVAEGDTDAEEEEDEEGEGKKTGEPSEEEE